MSAARWWFVPSIAALVWLLQFLRNTVTPVASQILSFDGDVALHVVLGDLMWASGALLPTEPTQTLLDGAPFIAHEWLVELVMSALHGAFGMAGPVLLAAAIVATLAARMVQESVRRGAGPWPAVIACVAAYTVMNGHLHPRPHVITWWLAFEWTVWLERHRTGELDDRAWALRAVLLMLLWPQMHAGFLVAFPIVALYGGGALFEAAAASDPGPPLRRFGVLTAGGIGALLASGLNPWGFSLHAHFLTWMSNDYMMGFTTEFAPPDFGASAGMFLAIYLGLMWLGLAAAGRAPAAAPFLLALVFTFLALKTARHGALFAAITAPWVALRLEESLAAWAGGEGLAARAARVVQASSRRLEASEAKNGGLGTILGVVALVVLLVGVWRTPEIRFLPTMQPIEASAWVKAHPEQVQGRMFNPFRWGAYLAYDLFPQHQTFINSWHDHLGEQALRTYFRVHDTERGWEAVLDEHQVQWVLYETRSRLAGALRRSEAWEEVHRDPTASIFVRRPVTTP
jgi:hypothetical protein